MMDAIQYLKARKRMCGEMECSQCPMGGACIDGDCVLLENADPEKAVEIVEAWMKEHPAKTRAEDFFEKFPNAARTEHGTPHMCAAAFGYKGCLDQTPLSETAAETIRKCAKCWNEPME